MTRRRSISASERARIFTGSGGICHICGHKIDGGREPWDVEHVIPLEMGGDDHGDNLQPAHRSCHKNKTAEDAKHIAKAKRMQQRAMGIKRQSRSRFQTNRDGRFKKKLDGTVVPR